jgi:hypothetical protein
VYWGFKERNQFTWKGHLGRKNKGQGTKRWAGKSIERASLAQVGGHGPGELWKNSQDLDAAAQTDCQDGRGMRFFFKIITKKIN